MKIWLVTANEGDVIEAFDTEELAAEFFELYQGSCNYFDVEVLTAVPDHATIYHATVTVFKGRHHDQPDLLELSTRLWDEVTWEPDKYHACVQEPARIGYSNVVKSTSWVGTDETEVTANAMMVGALWAPGTVPVTPTALEKAMQSASRQMQEAIVNQLGRPLYFGQFKDRS